MKKEKAKKIFGDLWTLRDAWAPAWKEIGSYLAPARGVFDDEDRTSQAKLTDGKKIVDTTPIKAVDTLAAGMMGGLTSPSLRWFFLRTKDDNQDPGSPAAKWLQMVQETMENVLDGAGVYNAIHNFYLEIATFGTAAFLIEADPKTVVRAVPLTVGEYAIDVDKRGKPCRAARKLRMTAWQMKQTFGEDKLPERVKQQINDKRYDQESVVYHLITPNEKRETGKADNKNMPYLSVYWAEGTEETYLRESGYEEFPLVCARWSVKNDAQVYGKAPGWTALSDVKMLQKLHKSKLVALDKIVNPAMMISSAVQGTPNLQAGGITRYNGTTDPGIKPVYQIQDNLQAMEMVIGQTQERIKQMFYVDLFLMLSGVDAGKMTATEVQARMQEKMMVLGPVLQRLKEELLDPLLDRVFNICWRSGILPPPPEEMQDAAMNVEYVSVIARAQKGDNTNTITQGFALLQNWAQMDPSVMDYVDTGAAVREAFKSMGVPASMLRSQEEVQNLQAARAQAQQQAQAAQEAQMLAQGAKTLSETPLNNGSALDATLQALNGGQE